MQLTAVTSAELVAFRAMVEAYWVEIMPDADVLQTEQQRATYFGEVFSWHGDRPPPLWAVVDGRRIGFVAYTLPGSRGAFIEDFYVAPAERRNGNGTAMLAALYARLDQLGVEVVELYVRRDSPQALAFWEAQGFRLASYRMRQYRDPVSGRSFVGALASDFRANAEC